MIFHHLRQSLPPFMMPSAQKENRRMLNIRLPFIFFALLLAAPLGVATAQDDDFDNSDGLLDLDGSEKIKAVPKVDPDVKLLKKAEGARSACEKRLNEFQARSGKLPDVDDAVNSASTRLSDAVYNYGMKHGAALENYRNFHRAGEKKSVKKYGKQIIKLRKGLIKAVKGVNRDLDKVVKLQKKLMKQIAEEDAEENQGE
jgi:hypothetical protein